jgi:hypothetical protein
VLILVLVGAWVALPFSWAVTGWYLVTEAGKETG